MSRAPSTLPFPLEPNPGPEQIYIQSATPQQNQRYISNICRAGPMPLSRHTITDPVCLILYILFFLTTLTLFLVNYFSAQLTTAYTFSELSFFDKFSNTLSQTLPQIMLSCACLIVLGIVFVLLIIAIPACIGYFILVLCLGLLGFILYTLIGLKWGEVFEKIHGTTKKKSVQITDNIFRICLIIITVIALIFTIYLLVRRLKKLKHLGAMMNVVKVILLNNLPILPIVFLFVISGVQLGIWCGFSKMLWTSVRMSLTQGMPIAPNLIIIFIVVLWLWTHGFLLSVADYLCQSWVIHWYYNAKNQENVDELGITDTALKQNWRSLLVKKLFRYHLGTCIYGSLISVFFIGATISLTKKLLKHRSNKPAILQNLTYLSRYSYIETIMQSLPFCTANKQTYHLRQRIKQKLPQIYMLGHFLEEVIKVMLSIGTLYLWFLFTYNLDRFFEKTVIDFSPELFFFFCFVVTFGIFLEVTTNISHLFGIVSDTAVIVYSIDCQIERVHYSQNMANSVPASLKEALMRLQVEIQTKPYQNSKQDAQLSVKQSMGPNNFGLEG